MSGELNRTGYPGVAASVIKAEQAVALAGNRQRGVVPMTDATSAFPHGVALTAASVGDPVTIRDEGNYAEVTAAASLGNGAAIGVVGATTSLGPIAVGNALGEATESANAGERFTFHVNPRKL